MMASISITKKGGLKNSSHVAPLHSFLKINYANVTIINQQETTRSLSFLGVGYINDVLANVHPSFITWIQSAQIALL